MMALTASTPILKGRLTDTNCRWGIISESVDDQTSKERGRTSDEGSGESFESEKLELADRGERRLYKCHYDYISTYILCSLYDWRDLL